MKRLLIGLALTGASALMTLKVLAACGSYFTPAGPDTFNGGPCPNNFTKTAHWDLFFTDGHETRDLKVQESGQCITVASGATYACYPGYNTPYWEETTVGKWNQITMIRFSSSRLMAARRIVFTTG